MTITIFFIPFSINCLICLSIKTSPFTFNKALGVSKQIGTNLEEIPAAKIIAVSILCTSKYFLAFNVNLPPATYPACSIFLYSCSIIENGLYNIFAYVLISHGIPSFIFIAISNIILFIFYLSSSELNFNFETGCAFLFSLGGSSR